MVTNGDCLSDDALVSNFFVLDALASEIITQLEPNCQNCNGWDHKSLLARHTVLLWAYSQFHVLLLLPGITTTTVFLLFHLNPLLKVLSKVQSPVHSPTAHIDFLNIVCVFFFTKSPTKVVSVPIKICKATT